MSDIGDKIRRQECIVIATATKFAGDQIHCDKRIKLCQWLDGHEWIYIKKNNDGS